MQDLTQVIASPYFEGGNSGWRMQRVGERALIHLCKPDPLVAFFGSISTGV